jgi:integrase
MTDLVPAPYASPSGSPPKLLDQVRQAIRLRHYSRRTEAAYVAWIRRFIVFHRKRHPRELGEREVTAFVSSLAARGMSASTQNQALSAILFLYVVVLGQRLGWMNDIVRAQRPARLPVVLSRDEVSSLLSRLRGPVWLMASLMYGAGLRLLECVELRVKDLNFDRGELTIRDGKGGKDRVTMLPAAHNGAAGRSSEPRESTARRRLGGWPRKRRPARFTAGQVPERAVRMGPRRRAYSRTLHARHPQYNQVRGHVR